ncbi:MAG TPA: GNAT family N-acetyltransferase [Terriglobales bacterium]|nr:GNAT family N-acetyltransferase [Terriglobales bacterium]
MKQAPAQVRHASPKDTPEIIRIVNAAFAVESFLDGTRTDDQRMAGYLQTGEFLVAEKDGEIVASIYIELHGERGYFGMLAVDPSRKGQGLGRVMIEAAENHCRSKGCKFMDIAVLSLRPELPPLYRKFGYVESGTDEFRPSRPLKPGYECHVIKMSKSL